MNANASCNSLNAWPGAGGLEMIAEKDFKGPVNIYWNREIADKDSYTSAKGTATVYKMSSNGYWTNVKNGSGTPYFNFYRMKKADFTTFEGAWENTDVQCDKAGSPGLNKQDGRAFQMSIRSLKMNKGSKLEYFDYPKCTLDTANKAHDWGCQMYLPLRDKQVDSYPRFDDLSVINGYYVSSYLPSLKDVSYAKSTELIAAAGSVKLAQGAALVAGVLAVMF